MPLHLEQHLDAATIVGSEVPADAPTVMEWHFDEPQDDWKPFIGDPTIDPVEVIQLDDALRVTLTHGTRNFFGVPRGSLFSRCRIGTTRISRTSWCVLAPPMISTISGSCSIEARGFLDHPGTEPTSHLL